MVTVSLENHVICYVLNFNQNNCKKLNFSVCKYLALNKLSKFGRECGFRHGEIGDNRINGQLTTAQEDVRNIKADIYILKRTVKPLAEINKYGKLINKSVDKRK